jgi:hypothetical protein
VTDDASDSSKVWSCCREPSRGNPDLGRGEDVHDDSMGHVRLSMTTATVEAVDSRGLSGCPRALTDGAPGELSLACKRSVSSC